MRMIAEEAGVSVVTVSLSLRNHPSISVRTRTRIQRIARRMDYRPNAMVSALMAQIHSRRPGPESPVLALVREPEARAYFSHIPFYQNLRRGAEARARALGYVLEDFILESGIAGGRRLHRILHARNIRGVILAPVFRPGGTTALPLDGLACCAMGYSLHSPDIHRVGSNYGQAMSLAWSKLSQRGYRRPGFVNKLQNLERTDFALLGSFMAQQALHPEAARIPPLIFSRIPDQYPEECGREFARWFRRHRPDVLIGPPWALLEKISESVRVPEEAGVILFDSEPGWTQVLDGAEQIGSGSVDMVVAQIHRNETGIPPFPQTVSVNSLWVEGRTLPARRRPSASRQ